MILSREPATSFRSSANSFFWKLNRLERFICKRLGVTGSLRKLHHFAGLSRVLVVLHSVFFVLKPREKHEFHNVRSLLLRTASVLRKTHSGGEEQLNHADISLYASALNQGQASRLFGADRSSREMSQGKIVCQIFRGLQSRAKGCGSLFAQRG